jgi:PST family polysaccharide transporter
VTPRVGKPQYYGKLAKIGLLWGFVREGTNFLLQLPTAVILARLLTPHEFGVTAAAYFFLQLCNRLTQFGFGVALVRAPHITEEHLGSVFIMNLALATAAWATLTTCAPLLGGFLHSPETVAVLPTVALGFFIVAFGTVPTALLSRDMRFRDSSTSDWFDTATCSVVTIVLAWRGYSYWSVVYGTLAGDMARVVVRTRMARHWPTFKCSRKAIQEMLGFGLGIYAKNLLDYSVQNLDNLLVGRLIGMTALGFYDKAYSTMARIIGKINLSGPNVSFRIFALIHDQPERFRAAYTKVVMSVTLVGYSVFTGMMVTAPELIEVLYGKRWLPAVIPFQFLCIAAMMRLLNTYASSATQAKGQIWSEVRRQALFTVVLVVAVAVMSRWGIAGAAAGVLISTSVMTVMLQRLIRQLSGLTWHDMLAPQIPAAVCAGGLAVVAWTVKLALRAAFPGAGAATLLFTCTLACMLYFVAFVLVGPFVQVRKIVHESLQDLAPGLARQVTWLAPTTKEAAAL